MGIGMSYARMNDGRAPCQHQPNCSRHRGGYCEAAEMEATPEIKRRLTSHALALARLAEEIERRTNGQTNPDGRAPTAPWPPTGRNHA
jgi:hypothetical protein